MKQKIFYKQRKIFMKMNLLNKALFSITAMMSLTTVALAEGAATPAQQNPVMSFLPFIIVFCIFYFMMIRPQKRRMQEEQTMLSSLTKGDEVFTKAGFIGTISGLTEKIVTLEVDNNVKLKVLRGQIAGKANKLFEEDKTEKTKK